MADHLELPANGNGPRVRVGGNRHRVRLTCDQLESRDATGSIVSGVVAAAFGGPLSDSLSELARLIGDWAFLDAAVRTSQSAGPMAPIADESPRKLARYDTWLEPALLFPEERPERGVRVTAPTAPADPGRGAFGDLPGGPPHLTGLINSNPFPSFVGVRATAVFAPESLQPPRGIVNGIGAAFVGQDSATLPFGVRLTVNADELDAPIPNNPPHAVADSITVSEDGSVVFDPSANDTDPDGDPLWVKLVQSETDNGRTYWEEGGNVRYIPDPDFHGEDSFGYLVTDGLDQYEGTVSVTVNSVNDAPVAFNDAYKAWSGPFILDDGTTPPTSKLTIAVLPNDIDYDGSGLTVGDLKASGSVAISADKRAVEWTVPNGGTAAVEFQYQATDDQGALSDWASVKAWAYPITPPGGPPPTIQANPDTFAIGGDDITTGNVMTNDSKETFAVLNSHPAGTRVTSFGFDGSVKLTPTLARLDAVFKYTLFSADAKEVVTGAVNVKDVNLTIHHGQDGKSVRELNERLAVGGAAGGNPLIPAFKATGAFTVANQNDSDADGSPDAFDNTVPENPAFPDVSGEKDLMKLVMSKPAPVAGFNDMILSVSSASTPGMVPAVNFWKVSIKGNMPQPLDANGKAAIPVNAIPAELWVEMTGVSPAIGDVSIEMEYAGATDTVNATGIWTKHDQTQTHQWPAGYFMNTGNMLPEDCDAKGIRRFFDIRGKVLGVVPNVPHETKAGWFHTRNNELSKFTVLPSGMTPFSVLGIVLFDATRSVEAKSTFITQPVGAIPPQDVTRPPWLDGANDESPQINDDKSSRDNDNNLLYNVGHTSTDNIYSWDAPGAFPWQPTATGVFQAPGVRLTDCVLRANFFDFVRISFGTPWVAGPDAGVQGSQSSVFYAWSNMIHIREKDPAEVGPPLPGAHWTMTRTKDPGTVTENRIEKGHININVAGGGVT